jgi:hypothetical protein
MAGKKNMFPKAIKLCVVFRSLLFTLNYQHPI